MPDSGPKGNGAAMEGEGRGPLQRLSSTVQIYSCDRDERRDRGWVDIPQIIGLQCLGGSLAAGQRINRCHDHPCRPMRLLRPAKPPGDPAARMVKLRLR
jgi:hypothetical protein